MLFTIRPWEVLPILCMYTHVSFISIMVDNANTRRPVIPFIQRRSRQSNKSLFPYRNIIHKRRIVGIYNKCICHTAKVTCLVRITNKSQIPSNVLSLTCSPSHKSINEFLVQRSIALLFLPTFFLCSCLSIPRHSPLP